MDKKITIFAFLFLALILFSSNFTPRVRAAEVLNSPAQTDEVVARKLDPKAKILQSYLQKFDSPMQDHAQDFIDAAKLYNLDWKMLPAIAGVESTFGKEIPGGYNAYGWGVYGTQVIYFTSWTDGIFTVAKGLRENYLNKGVPENPYAINKVYAASPTWGAHVSFFMNDLAKFAQNYIDTPVVAVNKVMKPDEKIAAVSGLLSPNSDQLDSVLNLPVLR